MGLLLIYVVKHRSKMDLLHMLLVLVIAFLCYTLGYIPWTQPHYERRLREYYFNILRSVSCTEITLAMDELGDDLIHYIMKNHEELDVMFPKAPLQHHVQQLRCVDMDTGVPMSF